MEHQQASGTIARSHAVEMARSHLAAGYDVIVPQLAARPALIDQLAAAAAEMKAEFYEVMLLDSRENLLRRWERHASNDPSEPGRFNAQQLVEDQGGISTVGAYYDRLMAMLSSRADALVIQTTEGQLQEAYTALLQRISPRQQSTSS